MRLRPRRSVQTKPNLAHFKQPTLAKPNQTLITSVPGSFLRNASGEALPMPHGPCGNYLLTLSVCFRGWQSYDAVDWAPVCPQPIKYVGATKNAPLMDEDCLYLNIFTPTVESTVSENILGNTASRNKRCTSFYRLFIIYCSCTALRFL